MTPKTRKHINKFEQEITAKIKEYNLCDFKMKIDHDKIDDIYFFYHNIPELEEHDIYDFITEKIDELLFENDVESCFIYSREYSEKLKMQQNFKLKDTINLQREIEKKVGEVEKDLVFKEMHPLRARLNQKPRNPQIPEVLNVGHNSGGRKILFDGTRVLEMVKELKLVKNWNDMTDGGIHI